MQCTKPVHAQFFRFYVLIVLLWKVQSSRVMEALITYFKMPGFEGTMLS